MPFFIPENLIFLKLNLICLKLFRSCTLRQVLRELDWQRLGEAARFSRKTDTIVSQSTPQLILVLVRYVVYPANK